MTTRGTAIVFGILCIGLGVWMLWRPAEGCRVTVTNDTDRPVAWVAIDHARGGERIDHLAAHASRSVTVRVRGESSIGVRVRFDDGAAYSHAAEYVEPGYAMRVALRDTGAAVEVRLPGR